MKDVEATIILESFLDDIKGSTFSVIINEKEVEAIKQLIKPHLKRKKNRELRETIQEMKK